MKKIINIILFLSFSLLAMTNEGVAQTYFKVSEASDDYYEHKITRFSEGDILIGDSSLEALKTGDETGRLMLTRLDNCGNVIWSNEYFLSEGYLEFKNFRVNEADEIFVYGSFYKGLGELIFLFKVNGETGESIDFSLFNTGTVDHFSYAMDLKNGQLMIYGLVLDFDTQKLGFIAVFNERLTLQWAKQFAPFESDGVAIIDKDGGFIGRSSGYLMKFMDNGDLEWATKMEVNNYQVVSGPVEVPNGFIMEANRDDLSFFYKVDNNGQLVWKTDEFPASKFGAAMSLLPDGNLLSTYNCPSDNLSQLCQLTLSADGQISNQRRLVFGSLLKTGNLTQTISEANFISIAGNSDPFNASGVDIKDFMLQFSLDSLPEDCFFWEDFAETTANNVNLDFSFYDFVPTSFEMELERKIKLNAVPVTLPLKDICGTIIDPNSLNIDTFLPCEADWVVALPAPDFEWVDDTPDNPRLITLPGTYKAKKITCVDPVIVNYTLEKPSCGCLVYLPTAFSPNNDGINDQLAVFSACNLETLEMSVFNRWGERLFYSENVGGFWDGFYQQKNAPVGVYFVMLEYTWIDTDGSLQAHSLFKEVTLMQ